MQQRLEIACRVSSIATFQKKPIEARRQFVQTPRAENRSTALARITMGMFLPGAEERNQA